MEVGKPHSHDKYYVIRWVQYKSENSAWNRGKDISRVYKPSLGRKDIEKQKILDQQVGLDVVTIKARHRVFKASLSLHPLIRDVMHDHTFPIVE